MTLVRGEAKKTAGAGGLGSMKYFDKALLNLSVTGRSVTGRSVTAVLIDRRSGSATTILYIE
jgi:hypothetical protein